MNTTLIDTPYGPARCLHPAPRPGLPAALLVHGSGGRAEVWDTMLGRFAHLNPYAVDLPGRAGSTGPQRETAEEYAAFLDAVRAGLGLPAALIVGQSLGGAIAQQYARDYAGRCLGIVVANSAPDFNISEERLRAIADEWEEAAASYAAGQLSPGASEPLLAAALEMVRQREPDVFADDLRTCHRFNSRPWAGELKPPVLILAGREDRLTALPRSLALLELIPHAELVVLSPCGHCTMLEQPARFAAQVDLFAQHAVALPQAA
jgi:pimeloyl-ACP methyl ester carboxylesterase